MLDMMRLTYQVRRSLTHLELHISGNDAKTRYERQRHLATLVERAMHAFAFGDPEGLTPDQLADELSVSEEVALFLMGVLVNKGWISVPVVLHSPPPAGFECAGPSQLRAGFRQAGAIVQIPAWTEDNSKTPAE